MKKNIVLIALAIYFIVRQGYRYYKHGFHIFLQGPDNKHISSNPYFNTGYVVGSNGGLIALLIILGILVYRKFYAKQSV